jgi:phage RecT family recombinase
MNQIAIADQAGQLIDSWKNDIAQALPANITYQKMRSTFITAVAHNPDILKCDTQSIFTALLKCAIDNLLPDNREASIVPFNTKVKEGDREVYKLLAQYMPMIQGIRKRARELGGIRTIISEVVFSNDFFEYEAGDDPKITHKAPKLGEERGQIVGAYAIFKDDEDVIVHREVQDKKSIEAARNVSRAKEGPAWRNFYDEMARKTVVRRGAKSIPSLPEELRRIIERDDEYSDFQMSSSRTIDASANPLLDDQSGRRMPMEAINSETGEVTGQSSSRVEPAAHNRQSSGSSPETGTKSSSRAPRNGDDQEDGGGDADSGSTASRIKAAVLEEYSVALLRFASRESLNKGAKQFWDGNDGFPKNQEDDRLARLIFDQHSQRADGQLTVDEVKNNVAKAIKDSFAI